MPIKDVSVKFRILSLVLIITGYTSRKESNGTDEFFQFIIPKAKGPV